MDIFDDNQNAAYLGSEELDILGRVLEYAFYDAISAVKSYLENAVGKDRRCLKKRECKNNPHLSPLVKDAMKRRGARVSITQIVEGCSLDIIINALMADGTYDTFSLLFVFRQAASGYKNERISNVMRYV